MLEIGVLRDREPVELLEGELLVMPSEGPPHAASASTLRDCLLAAYQGKTVSVREDKPLVAGLRSLPQPDVAVVRGDHSIFAKRHPRGDEAILVIEIAYSSLAIDRFKTEIYAAAKVPVCWIVDYEARHIEVHSSPKGRKYGSVRVMSEGDEVPLPGTRATLRARDFLL